MNHSLKVFQINSIKIVRTLNRKKQKKKKNKKKIIKKLKKKKKKKKKYKMMTNINKIIHKC